MSVEEHVRLLMSRTGKEPVLRLAGDYRSEALVYHVLSIVLSRLAKQGAAYAVCGSPFIFDQPPARPEAPVTVLLNAPSFDDLSTWTVPRAGQGVILVGASESWERIGITPDVSFSDASSDSVFHPYIDRLKGAARSEHMTVRAGICANSLGVDWPMELLRESYFNSKEAELPFVPVENMSGTFTGFVSVEGQWLGAHALTCMGGIARRLRAELCRLADTLPNPPGARLIRLLSHLS